MKASRTLSSPSSAISPWLQRDAFWGVMDNKRWVYPYDAKGERRHFKDLPKSISDLKDDPFRSLAGELRRIGGFAKDTTPFSEFLWADFLRRQMSRGSVDANFPKRPWKKASRWRKPRMRFICRAGADPRRTISAHDATQRAS